MPPERARRKGHKGHSAVSMDIEAPPIDTKVLSQEFIHGMVPPYGMISFDSRDVQFQAVSEAVRFENDEDDASERTSTGSVQGESRASEASISHFVSCREMALDKHDRSIESILKSILESKDYATLKRQLTLIPVHELRLLDAEIPGNIYSVNALDYNHFTPHSVFSRDTIFEAEFVQRVGFILIILIQLFGPPLVAWQSYSGKSFDGYDQIQWDRFTPSFSDFRTGDGYWTTKLLALLFVSIGVLNGLVCHLGESKTWSEINALLRAMKRHGGRKNTSQRLHALGAFVNTWVFFWLGLDVFVVLGRSETIQDVLLDALGLTFLSRIDDIGGDLGLVDCGKWPGLEMAWVFSMRDFYAAKPTEESKAIYMELDDDSEAKICLFGLTHQRFCEKYLLFCTWLLTTMAIVLPVLFVITPFKKLRPAPFFQELHSEKIVRALILNTTRSEM